MGSPNFIKRNFLWHQVIICRLMSHLLSLPITRYFPCPYIIYRVFSKNLNLNYINFLKRFMYTEPFYWLYRILANYFTKNMGAITHSMGAITHSLPDKTFLEAVLSSSYVDYKTILARNSASRKVNLPECRV